MAIISDSKKKMARRGAFVSSVFIIFSSILFYFSFKDLAIFIAVCGSYVPSTWDLLDG